LTRRSTTIDPRTAELEAWPLDPEHEVEDGPTLQLGPGTIGLLHAGDRTTWHVHETLRKVFQVTNS
jgi:hypothetical protein